MLIIFSIVFRFCSLRAQKRKTLNGEVPCNSCPLEYSSNLQSAMILVRLREPVAVGVGHQLEAIGDAQLGEDRREVVDDRRLADRQALADLSVFQALAN